MEQILTRELTKNSLITLIMKNFSSLTCNMDSNNDECSYILSVSYFGHMGKSWERHIFYQFCFSVDKEVKQRLPFYSQINVWLNNLTIFFE